MMKIIASLALVLALFYSSQVAAAKLKFGEQDKLVSIQEVELTGSEGEALNLGYRITTRFFIGGIYLIDQGYVLPTRDSENGDYYSLTEDRIAEMQQEGSLPTPLPVYTISWQDYLLGYSLWIIVGIVLLYVVLKLVSRKPKETDAL